MRLLLTTIGLSGIWLVGWSQDSPSNAAARRARDLLNDARSAPVEIFADIALNSKLLPLLTTQEKANILQSVFWRASEAVEPWPLRYTGQSLSEGPDADRVAIQLVGLDSLTIRCRVVLQLLRTDAKLARRLFESIPRGVLPKAGCRERFVPDPGVYVQTLAAIAESSAFSEEERRRGVPQALVGSCAKSVGNSWEIIAIAQALPKFGRTEEGAIEMASAITRSLTLSDNDPAFSSATRAGSLVARVLTASEKLHAAGATELPVLLGLRGFLVRHFTAVRCADNASEAHGKLPDTSIRDEFNTFLRGRIDVDPISAKESEPAKLESAPVDDSYKNAAQFRSIAAEVEQVSRVVDKARADNTLTVTMQIAPFKDEEATGLRARQVLLQIEDLHPWPGQDPREVFHQRCFLLRTLLTAPLGDNTLRRVQDLALSELSDSNILSRSPAEWLVEFRNFMGTGRIDGDLSRPGEYKIETPKSDKQLLRTLTGARLAAMSLYGRLELFDSRP